MRSKQPKQQTTFTQQPQLRHASMLFSLLSLALIQYQSSPVDCFTPGRAFLGTPSTKYNTNHNSINHNGRLYTLTPNQLFPSSRRGAAGGTTSSSSNNHNNLNNINNNNINNHLLPENNISTKTNHHPVHHSHEHSSALNSMANATDLYSWEEVLIAPLEQPEPDKPYHPHHLTRQDAFWIAASSVAAVGSFAWLILASGPGAWRYYLSGGICAAASHVVPVPIDVVKTRKQIDPSLADQHFLTVTKQIIDQEGPAALLGGFGPTALGYLLEGSIKFGVYEVLKPYVLQFLAVMASVSTVTAFFNSQFMSFLLSAALSGVAASIILCPMEALRIRVVAYPEQFSADKGGWVQGGYQIIRHEGVSALGKGIIPMILKQVPYTITKNVSFDYLTRYAYATLISQGLLIGATAKMIVPLSAAIMASILSCITSQPGDMLLSLINSHSGTNHDGLVADRRRTRDIVKDILRSEKGIRGFFVGMKTRFLHVGIIVTLQLLIYDFVKRLCGIAATGM